MALFPVFVILIVFLFVYLVIRLSTREKELRRRIELVERALESGAIDDETKRQLLEAVTNRRHGLAPGHHPVFVIGWVGLFAGLGMMGIATTGLYHWWPAAIMTTAISFGVLSVPLAARELQSRRHA